MNDALHPSLIDKDTASLIMNASLDGGKISPIPQPEEYDNGNPHKTDDLDNYGSDSRSFVKWYGIPYWSNNRLKEGDTSYGTKDATWGGSSHPWTPADGDGIGVPYCTYKENYDGELACPSFSVEEQSDSGLTDGVYRYCLTFVNHHGWEGAPGELDSYYKEITTTSSSGNKVTISLANVTIPANVWYAKIYRTTSHGADYYYVGSLYHSSHSGDVTGLPDGVTENGWVLVDTLEDSVLTMRSPLRESQLYNYPPPVGGKYLCESNSVFFLAKGDRLYFSVQDNPHAWPALNTIGFGETIVAITPDFTGGVLVFSANRAWRVTGADSQETVASSPIPGDQGCVAMESVSSVGETPIWLSNDGICTWDGQSIHVITYRRLNVEKHDRSVLAATSHDGKYYLLLSSGIIVYDLRNGGVFHRMNVKADYLWTDADKDTLYMQRNGVVRKFVEKSSNNLLWTYRSPLIGGTEMVQRIYTSFLSVCSSQCHLVAEVDGVPRLGLDIPAGRTSLKFPRRFAGRGLQLIITGKGELSELSVSYT